MPNNNKYQSVCALALGLTSENEKYPMTANGWQATDQFVNVVASLKCALNGQLPTHSGLSG